MVSMLLPNGSYKLTQHISYPHFKFPGLLWKVSLVSTSIVLGEVGRSQLCYISQTMYYQSSDREGLQGSMYRHIRTTLSKTQVWKRETTIVFK